jgi:hypothetical protein
MLHAYLIAVISGTQKRDWPSAFVTGQVRSELYALYFAKSDKHLQPIHL